MLKRTALLLITLLYFTCSSGVAVTLHYCGSNPVAFTVGEYAKKDCCKDKPVKKSCCKNAFQYIKIKASHAPVNSLKASSVFEFISTPVIFAPVIITGRISSSFLTASHNPPRYRSVPVYLSKQLFLI